MKENFDEKEIAAKVAAGLSRENALQVLRDQAIDDDIRAEREEAAEAAARKAKAENKDKEPNTPTAPDTKPEA